MRSVHFLLYIFVITSTQLMTTVLSYFDIHSQSRPQSVPTTIASKGFPSRTVWMFTGIHCSCCISVASGLWHSWAVKSLAPHFTSLVPSKVGDSWNWPSWTIKHHGDGDPAARHVPWGGAFQEGGSRRGNCLGNPGLAGAGWSWVSRGPFKGEVQEWQVIPKW